MSVPEPAQPTRPVRRVVSDTGPLISLERLTDGFAFIRRLYDQIVIPPAVLEEVGLGSATTVQRTIWRTTGLVV